MKKRIGKEEKMQFLNWSLFFIQDPKIDRLGVTVKKS